MKTSRLLLVLGFSLITAIATLAQAPTPAPAPDANALKLQQQFSELHRSHAKMVAEIAKHEFRATDPSLSAEDRKTSAEIARITRDLERKLRPDGQMVATEYGTLKKANLTTQSEKEALAMATMYGLPKALKTQLELFESMYAGDAGAKKRGEPAWVYFGRELAKFSETLPAEGRREKLRAYVGERRAALPPDDGAGVNPTLVPMFQGRINGLLVVAGDAIAALEGAELLIQMDGYTAENYALLAEALARNGKRDAALRALDVALVLDEKNERALKWEKTLNTNAPELYTGVVEEPADPYTIASVSVMGMLGQAPTEAQLLSIEAAARTFGHRVSAALRAPADRRRTAVQQAVALQAAMKGVLFDPTKTQLSDGQKAVGEAMKTKNLAEAQKAFDAIPFETSTHVVYWQVRALPLILQSKYADVLDSVTVVEAIDPTNAWAKSNRPKLEAILAPASPAPAVAAPAVASHAVTAEVRSDFFHTADTAIRQGEIARAETLVNEALVKNPADGEALLLRSRIRFANRDLPGAEADLNTVITGNGPMVAAAYGQLALLQAPQKRTSEAAAATAKALELSPDQPDALLAQAGIDMQQKNPTGALEKISRAIAARPNFEEAYGARAMITMQQGHAPEAIQILKDNLAKNPQSVMLHVQLVALYMATARVDLMRSEVNEIAKLKDPRATQIATSLGGVVAQFDARIKQAQSAATVPSASTVPTPAPVKK